MVGPGLAIPRHFFSLNMVLENCFAAARDARMERAKKVARMSASRAEAGDARMKKEREMKETRERSRKVFS